MTENHIQVSRTSRYFTLGAPGEHIKEVWFVCHGYGQLAEYFLGNFKNINNATRLFVAPEALSRFYLNSTYKTVGASWMTREDRLNEINDYVSYLDALYQRIFSEIRRERVKVTLLGFSQSTATVCRWISRGQVKADRLILWAGLIPPELDLEKDRQTFANLNLTLVLGTSDQYARPEIIAEQESRLNAHRIPFQFLRFEGGHIIHQETLKKLAGE